MSAAVVISSSPPRIFTRDPTPVSPPGSQTASRPLGSQHSPNRFKRSTAIRDSFSNSFSSARALLAKAGAENLSLHSTPPKDRFKTRVSSPKRRSPPFISHRSQSDLKSSELCRGRATRSGPVDIEEQKRTAEASLSQLTPERTYKSVPRRTDWTPVRDNDESRDTPPNDLHIWGEAVGPGLMDNFGFKSTRSALAAVANSTAEHVTIKKVKLDVLEVAGPIIQKAEKRKGRASAPKKPKAAPKKPKTITDLVTAHQRGKLTDESTLAGYLVATQARMVDGPASDDNIEVATTSKRPKATAKRKSKLLSPTSAMKAVVEQQPMFGSLSQLARDGPLIEADLSSDPLSPMRTQAISIESTTPRPARGTSRFVRSRNLWGMAERDGNNALVFPDTFNPIGTPTIHAPPAVGNVLLQTMHRPSIPSLTLGAASPQNRTAVAVSPLRAFHTSAVLDVDDFSSPANMTATEAQRRHVLASEVPAAFVTGQQLKEADRDVAEDQAESASRGDGLDGMVAPPVLPRPRYAGMHTDDLKKAIQGYGFKPIKSRQKMIEKLEECWDQKEARRVAKASQPAATQIALKKQSDFITDVHGLSSRPVPKVKKARSTKKATTSPKEPKKRKGEASAVVDDIEAVEAVPIEPKKRKSKALASGDATDSAEAVVKEPKKRKRAVAEPSDPTEEAAASPKPKPRRKATTKKTENDGTEQPKKPRGRKPKAPTMPAASVVDVDDIDDEFTNLTALREEKEQQRLRLKAMEVDVLPTPPATLHLHPSEVLSQAEADVATGGTSLPLELSEQIYAAILHQSREAAHDPERDHVRNPTWHEKILMYDPIVLEDLAWWLNAEGLGKIKEDREVTALDVRSWCESNGICCLWKGGWRGQASKKSSD